MSPAQASLRSGIYRGTLTHSRHHDPPHSFRYNLTMPLLFLDEVDEVMAGHPLWSSRSPAPVWLRRSDYLKGRVRPGQPVDQLDDAVRQVVEEQLGRRPTGRVAMLAQLRTWGWLFNPISLYYCFHPDGHELDAVVAEVTNTPWKERHLYALDGRAGEHRFAKAMHVSPFMGMDHQYVMSWSVPGEVIAVHMGNRREGAKVFDAALVLRRHEISHGEQGRMVWRRPAQTYGVSAGIYRQALSLARRGAPFHPHPVPDGADVIGQQPVTLDASHD